PLGHAMRDLEGQDGDKQDGNGPGELFAVHGKSLAWSSGNVKLRDGGTGARTTVYRLKSSSNLPAHAARGRCESQTLPTGLAARRPSPPSGRKWSISPRTKPSSSQRLLRSTNSPSR